MLIFALVIKIKLPGIINSSILSLNHPGLKPTPPYKEGDF